MRAAVCLFLGVAWAAAQRPPAQGAPEAAANPKRIDSLHDFSSSLEELSRRVSRAVVQIFSTGYAINEEGASGSQAAVITRQRATGSGVVLTADGYIVTNAHVVSSARRVRVRFPTARPATPSRSPAPRSWTRASWGWTAKPIWP